MKTENTIPMTDFTTIVAITKYDAKQFLGRIQSQIEILEMVNKKDESKHWQELSRQAHLLFGITYNGTDMETQKEIEAACENQKLAYTENELREKFKPSPSFGGLAVTL